MAVELRGWHPDPYRQHEMRYFSIDGQPSRLVSTGGKTSLDPPWPAHLSSRPLPAVAAAPPPSHDWGLEPCRVLETLDVTEGMTESALRVTGEPEAAPGPSTTTPSILESMVRNLSDRQRASVRRVIRFGSVSAISTVVGLVSLGIFIGLLGYPVIWSNILAKAIATIPAFELSRRWVWAQSGERSILRQAVPFALLSFAGLILSTFAVHLAADATAHSSRLIHTAAAELASIASYVPLLLIQFALCDRVLFSPRSKVADMVDSNSPCGRDLAGGDFDSFPRQLASLEVVA
jgi:putative flippase GtrA